LFFKLDAEHCVFRKRYLLYLPHTKKTAYVKYYLYRYYISVIYYVREATDRREDVGEAYRD